MIKKLITLPSIIGITLGTINTIINTQNNEKTNSIIKEHIIKYSEDISKYDLTNKPVQNVPLNNLLQLFKEMNQTRKENKSKISFDQLPRWNLISDNGTIFAFGWLFQTSNMLEKILNLDEIEFKNLCMTILKDFIIIYLDYNVQNEFKSLTLLIFEDNSNQIPLKQEKMITAFEFIYNDNKI